MGSRVIEAEIQRWLRQPYMRVVRGEPGEGYVAMAPELPGCVTAGETDAEALANLDEAMAAWLESALTHHDPIPAPAADTLDERGLYIAVPWQVYDTLTERAQTEGRTAPALAAALLSASLTPART